MARIVVGLGNPGPEYAHTRHNVGFMTVKLLGERLGVTYWKDEAGSKVGQVRLGATDLVLATPQAFMNRSGKPVRRLLEYYETEVSGLIVVHDDIDLPEESVRVKFDGGHGGHNGLRSILEDLGSGEFARVRIGIGRPPGRMDPADFVLDQLRGAALESVESVIPTAAQCVMHVLEHGHESAMREFNAD